MLLGLAEQDKIDDPAWVTYKSKSWNHYTLVAEGVNTTGVTHYHVTELFHVSLNDTYPYDYIGLLEVSTASLSVCLRS